MQTRLHHAIVLLLLVLPWMAAQAVETQLLVTASDDGQPTTTLTYTWSVTAAPAAATGALAAQILATPSATIPGATAQNPRVVLSVAGSYTFHVAVSDGNLTTQGTSAQDVTITVRPPVPVITTTTLPGGQVGVAYSQTLQANNTPTSWTVSAGTLPTGLSLAASTGIISGTPTTVGTSTFSVTATNASGASIAKSISLAVSAANTPPTIAALSDLLVAKGSTIAPVAITIGDNETAAANLTLSAVSDTPTLVPNSGLMLGGSGTARTLTITPVSGQSGKATITVTVTDAGGLTATRSFVLTINSPPQILSVSAGQTTLILP